MMYSLQGTRYWVRTYSPYVLAALASLALGMVRAQEASPSRSTAGGLEEIVVTAEKRTSTVERTPVAITALTGQTLEDRQLNAITDVQGVVPNFRIGLLTGGAVVSIRGIGINSVLPTVEGAAAVNREGIGDPHRVDCLDKRLPVVIDIQRKQGRCALLRA